MTPDQESFVKEYQRQVVLDLAILWKDHLNRCRQLEAELIEETTLLQDLQRNDKKAFDTVLAVIHSNAMPSLMDVVNS